LHVSDATCDDVIESGGAQVELFAWTPLEAMPWTYVISGAANALLGAW
jgi:hypothetical protein